MNFAYLNWFLYQISLWTNNIEFVDQIYPRKILKFKNRKSKHHHHWILHIQISLGTKFQLLIKFTQKGFSGLKRKKGTPLIFHTILHIQISQARNFSSNWQFWFFGSNLPKKVFPVENTKSEHHHRILHIWISVSTKFQLKLIILSFWNKFTPKRYFQSKTTSSPRTASLCFLCSKD